MKRARNVKSVIRELLARRNSVQPGEVAKAAGVSRQTAHHHLRELVAAGELVRQASGRATRYHSLALDHLPARLRYTRAGLTEDGVWRDLAERPDVGALPPTAHQILQYVVTELVNNAIDHSSATDVDVALSQADARVFLVVEDDGVGIFVHVRDRLGLPNELEAVQELHKGKVTTQPDAHTGEGLFFVSKAVDNFEVFSGTLGWIVDNERSDTAVVQAARREGTLVRVAFQADTSRTLRSVFDAYTDDFEFSRTRTVVRLFANGVSFVSRSEAKRLVHGLEKFREVVMDFQGITGVGQGFADEVFRVWAVQHPGTKLIPVNMNEMVEFMVRRALAKP